MGLLNLTMGEHNTSLAVALPYIILLSYTAIIFAGFRALLSLSLKAKSINKTKHSSIEQHKECSGSICIRYKSHGDENKISEIKSR